MDRFYYTQALLCNNLWNLIKPISQTSMVKPSANMAKKSRDVRIMAYGWDPFLTSSDVTEAIYKMGLPLMQQLEPSIGKDIPSVDLRLHYLDVFTWWLLKTRSGHINGITMSFRMAVGGCGICAEAMVGRTVVRGRSRTAHPGQGFWSDRVCLWWRFTSHRVPQCRWT